MNKFELFLNLWKRFWRFINEKGIPFPMIRDPKTGQGSITATLVVVSSGACILAVNLMMGVFISKINGWFILTEDTLNSLNKAFDASFQLYLASLAAYLGRKFQKDKSMLSDGGADGQK